MLGRNRDSTLTTPAPSQFAGQAEMNAGKSLAIFQGSYDEMNKLSDKVALIIGAGSGIDRAIAKLFQIEDAPVALADLNETSCIETVRGDRRTFRADVTSSESVEALAHYTAAKGGIPGLTRSMAG